MRGVIIEWVGSGVRIKNRGSTLEVKCCPKLDLSILMHEFLKGKTVSNKQKQNITLTLNYTIDLHALVIFDSITNGLMVLWHLTFCLNSASYIWIISHVNKVP